MKQVAILGHWHSGTTLVAKTFRACGMKVGNANTFWTTDSEAQCEHGAFNGIGDALVRGDMDSNTAISMITEILKSYVAEGEANAWECFGIKTTHALQSQSWSTFKFCFDHIWKDIVYILCLRHPFGIVASTHDPKWSDGKIMQSWESIGPAVVELCDRKNVIPLRYPHSWYNGNIKRTVEMCGLEWSPEAESLFNPEREKVFKERDLPWTI